MGRGTDRLKECPERRRLFCWRIAALGIWISRRIGRNGERRPRRTGIRADLLASLDRSVKEESAFRRDSVEFLRDQSPLARAPGAVCCARRLVRGERTDLPRKRTR